MNKTERLIFLNPEILTPEILTSEILTLSQGWESQAWDFSPTWETGELFRLKVEKFSIKLEPPQSGVSSAERKMAFVNLRQMKRYNTRNDSIIHPYHNLFRFTRENVNYLAEHLLEDSQETRGGALSAKQRIECLRYVGDPGF